MSRRTVSRSLVYSGGSSKALSGAAGTGCSLPKERAVILGFYVCTLALSSLGLISTDDNFMLICTDFLLWQFPFMLSRLMSMYTSLPMMYTNTRSPSHSSILSPKILHSFTKNGRKSSILIEENSGQKTEILDLGL